VSPRNSVILALLILIVLAVYVYTGRDDRVEPEPEAVRTVLALTREEIREIAVERDDGTVVRLERVQAGAAPAAGDAGAGGAGAGAPGGTEGREPGGGQPGSGEWRLTEPVVWAANPVRVTQMLNVLEEVRAERSLTATAQAGAGAAGDGEAGPVAAGRPLRPSDPQVRATYGLDDPAAVITVRTSRGEEKLVVGDATPVGAAYYAYLEGSDELVTVSAFDVLPFLAPVDEYRDRTIVSFALSDVRRLQIETREASVTLARDGQAWNLVEPVEHPADEQAITELLMPVATLVAREFIDQPGPLEAYGLSEPQAVLRLTVGEGERETTHVLYVGDAVGEGRAYVKREGPVVFVTFLDPAPLAGVTALGVALKDLVLTNDIFTTQIELLSETGVSLTLIKSEDENRRIRWSTREGHVVEPRMMTEFLGAVIALDAQDLGWPVEDVSAVDLNYVILRLQPPPGEGGEGWPRVVRIGRPDGSGSVEATVNTRNRVYRMPEEALSNLLARAREIFDAAYGSGAEDDDGE